jgi:nicotinamidase-related amidase
MWIRTCTLDVVRMPACSYAMAFEGTPLNMALRDCGIDAFAIVGIAMEIGIEPTMRQGADLGYIPVVVKDACGFGHRDAAESSIASSNLRPMLC